MFSTALNSLSNVDQIADFSVTEDKIQLDRSVFMAFGSASSVGPGTFKIGTAASTADEHLIYNQNTGDLFYDIDGSGSAAQIKLAMLTKGLALKASHFEIIGYGPSSSDLYWF